MDFKIGFIGAGKVGVTLGKYFSINELQLSGYYSKNLTSAKEAAIFTNSSYYENIENLVSSSDIIFITTPDDIIKDVWLNIQGFNIRNKIVCHTSGSLSSNIFSNIHTSGAYGFSIHPIFPFADKFNTYKTLQSAYFSIEGAPEKFNEIRGLFGVLGNKIILINAKDKALYHLANVMVSNLVLSLLNIGSSYFDSFGLSNDEALSSLMPLIESNLSNIKAKGFTNALTGPIERNDIDTINKHLQCIPKEHEELYKCLSSNLISIAEQKNPERNYGILKDILGGKL